MVYVPEEDRATVIGNMHKKLVKIARVVSEISCHTDRQTDRPVGFYGPIAPSVPNAPSSRISGQDPRNDADATFLDPHIVDYHCCCSAGMPVASTDAARDDRRKVAGMAFLQTSKSVNVEG